MVDIPLLLGVALLVGYVEGVEGVERGREEER